MVSWIVRELRPDLDVLADPLLDVVGTQDPFQSVPAPLGHRLDAPFSALMMSSSRRAPSVSNPQSVSKESVRVATPRPRAAGATT
jgi:hypothetical protein